MRQTFILLCFIVFFISCTKTISTNSVSSLYKENYPVVGRSQLNFISNTLVVKSEKGSSYYDTFSYLISNNKITLTPIWTTQYPGQDLDFTVIDSKSFQIENLYASIPESPKTYMIFKK